MRSPSSATTVIATSHCTPRSACSASTTGERRQRGRALAELGLEALQAIDLLIDGAHRFLKHDLLRRRRTDDLREVPTVRVVPVGAPDVVQPEPQQERLQPELRVLQRDPRRIARATQIADRFVLDRRHVDGASDRPSAATARARRHRADRSSPCRPACFGISDGATT